MRRPKAKTAWELLERVCEHILAEPAGYDQGEWCVIDRTFQRQVMGETTDCGTVACRAGWIVLLQDGPRLPGPSDIRERAEEILDVGWRFTESLFDGGAVDSDIYERGTPEYAKEGVRGLREFMKEHEAHLKARKLRGV